MWEWPYTSSTILVVLFTVLVCPLLHAIGHRGGGHTPPAGKPHR